MHERTEVQDRVLIQSERIKLRAPWQQLGKLFDDVRIASKIRLTLASVTMFGQCSTSQDNHY